MSGLPHPPEWDLLLSAAQKNKPDEVKRLVETIGADPSHSNAVGQSALHIASLWGHIEVTTELLKQGANVRAQNKLTGATPLHMAVQSRKAPPEQQETVIKLLLEYGADPMQADTYGDLPVDGLPEGSPLLVLLEPKLSPIFDAVQQRSLEGVRAELPAAKDIRHRGQTPLVYAMAQLSASQSTDDVNALAEIVGALLEAGSDPNQRVESDDGPNGPILALVLQALRDRYKENGSDTAPLEKLALSMKVAGVAQTSSETADLLHQAARRKEMPFARFLLERLQMDVNTPNRQGMTPLHFAARSRHLEMVSYLLSCDGIDPTLQDKQGKTALDAAKVNGAEEITALLEQVIPS